MELLPLARLPVACLPALAELHRATMPTLLSDLGQPVVLRYYQLARLEPSVIALVALAPQAAPLGYCLGSANPAALNAQLRNAPLWFGGQLLRLAVTRPRTLWQLAQSVLAAAEANLLQPGQIELTYIGVAPQARGQGLAKALLAAFIHSARQAHYTSIALSVETDNPGALALYARFGFTIGQTFREGRYHRHRMFYDLTMQQKTDAAASRRTSPHPST